MSAPPLRVRRLITIAHQCGELSEVCIGTTKSTRQRAAGRLHRPLNGVWNFCTRHTSMHACLTDCLRYLSNLNVLAVTTSADHACQQATGSWNADRKHAVRGINPQQRHIGHRSDGCQAGDRGCKGNHRSFTQALWHGGAVGIFWPLSNKPSPDAFTALAWEQGRSNAPIRSSALHKGAGIQLQCALQPRFIGGR